jgi:hypothetical protein
MGRKFYGLIIVFKAAPEQRFILILTRTGRI